MLPAAGGVLGSACCLHVKELTSCSLPAISLFFSALVCLLFVDDKLSCLSVRFSCSSILILSQFSLYDGRCLHARPCVMTMFFPLCMPSLTCDRFRCCVLIFFF